MNAVTVERRELGSRNVVGARSRFIAADAVKRDIGNPNTKITAWNSNRANYVLHISFCLLYVTDMVHEAVSVGGHLTLHLDLRNLFSKRSQRTVNTSTRQSLS